MAKEPLELLRASGDIPVAFRRLSKPVYQSDLGLFVIGTRDSTVEFFEFVRKYVDL
jgi:hypothetical protein